MKVAIDIDGVLLDIMVTYCKIFNNRYHTQYVKKDVIDWEFFKYWEISEKEAFEIFYDIYNNSMGVPFIDANAPDIMKKLRNCHNVFIVTARNPEYEAPIVKKLNYHNIKKGIHYEDLILLHHKPYDIKLSLDFDLYVDDNPNLVQSIKKMPNKKLLLYDQPWNRDLVLPDNVKRVFNWREIEIELVCEED
jgi:uncharacterized HAD superfamily protein